MAVTINGDTGVTTPGISNSEGYTGDGLTIAAGAPSGAVAVDSSGNVGIGTSSPSAKLHITQTGTDNALLVEDTASPDSTPFVIDASGKVILNNASAGPSGINYNFQNLGKSASEGMGLGMFTNDTGGMNLRFAKSRSTTVGSFSAVQAGDELGVIAFYGDDGTDINNRGAAIFSYVDGTVATNSIPSCLVFSTTAVGGTTATERARIDSSGNFQFNSGYGSVATAYGCRAWVNFNGTGTVAIRASGNVSSITDNGTGDYTVNFTTAMPDANYSALISGGNGVNLPMTSAHFTLGTSSFRFITGGLSAAVNAAVDPLFVNVAIFR